MMQLSFEACVAGPFLVVVLYFLFQPNAGCDDGLWFQLSFADRFLLHSVGFSTGQGSGGVPTS